MPLKTCEDEQHPAPPLMQVQQVVQSTATRQKRSLASLDESFGP